MNQDPIFHAFISPHQSSDVFSHPNEVECHSHRSAISVSPLLTASPVPRFLVSCPCSMCQSVPVTGAGLPPVFPTCAPPINQPHQQLVYQSALLFKLQSLTDSVPDRPLRDRGVFVFELAYPWSTLAVPGFLHSNIPIFQFCFSR